MQRSRLDVRKSEVAVRGGLCVAEHPLAAEAGAEILADGGNAIDAAVACAFAVGVVEPMMSGIGGGGAMIAHVASRTFAIDFLPRTPRAATPAMYRLDRGRKALSMFGWTPVVDDANIVGHRSVMVPGSVAGLCLAHRMHGRLPLARVMEPSIRLAADGYVVDWYIATTIASLAGRLRDYPEAARVFLPGGLPPAASLRTYLPAQPLRQPDLAETLRRIARNGAAEFYGGETGRAIVADMAANGGLVTAEDLASYAPVVQETLLTGSYRGMDLATLADPSGGVTALEILNILECFDLCAMGYGTPDALHVMIEAQRRAYADRFAHLASAEAAPPGWQVLADKAFARERAATIRLDRADREPPPASLPKGDPGCTTHLCTADRDGNIVTLTNTVGDLFGSHVVAPGTGVLLNDGMIWFDPEPDRANSVRGGVRPLSNATLFLGFRDGKPVLAVGSPGGRRVTTAVLQSIAFHLDHGFSLQQAIGAPRVHCEGPVAQVDDRLSAESLAELERRGHVLARLEETYTTANFARPVGITVADGVMRSGVDVLRPATAVGF